MIHALWHRSRRHTIPLLLVAFAAALGQIATLIQQPLVAAFDDTPTYVLAARGIATSLSGLVPGFRTPGYPLFLALVFRLAGSVNYQAVAGCAIATSSSPYCQLALQPVVVAQAAVAVLTTFECYVFVFRLTHQRWSASLVASLIAVNLYIMSWERTVLSELLSYWALVTAFLCFERLVRRSTLGSALLFVLGSFVAIMVRPFNIYLPALLLAILLLRSIWLKDLRSRWKHLLLSGVMLTGALFGYMMLNAQINNYFGLTWDPNLTLLGKVIEYRMQDLPVEPKYHALQADLHAYISRGGNDPWDFVAVYRSRGYAQNRYSFVGAYAQSVIRHHPVTFLRDSVFDIYGTWQARPTMYPAYWVSADHPTVSGGAIIPGITVFQTYPGLVSARLQPLWVTALLIVSTFEQGAFALLPVLIVLTACWIWRRPQQTESFILLCVLFAVTCSILLAAIGNYSEFYRVRFPMDWGMIVVSAIALIEGLKYAVKRDVHVAVVADNVVPASHPLLEAGVSIPSTLPPHPVPASPGCVRAEAPGDVTDRNTVEVSIVLPCLNEEHAIGVCVDAIQRVITSGHLEAEIIVVDNDSTDRSAEIAREHGARVVYQARRGYGNAYLKGFAVARGRYIVMADADNTYDFDEIEGFVALLRDGYDLVVGNRFSGRMAKGAMTWSHRYIGNPILSGMLNLLFHTGIRDAHCGMRAFTRNAYERMRLRTGGMEFASEMVINAAKAGLKITERPIAYHPRLGKSKLNTVRDGWRHLRFMLLYSPTYLFLFPGGLVMVAGIIVLALLAPGPFPLFGHRWDEHAMVLACLVTLVGFQIIQLGTFARFFSLTEELDGEQDRFLRWLSAHFTLERGLMCGGLVFLPGLVIDLVILTQWIGARMGPLDDVRPAIIATTLMVIGVQIAFASFFLSMLQLRKSIHTVGTRHLTAITDQNTMSPHSPSAAVVAGEALRPGEEGSTRDSIGGATYTHMAGP